MIPVHNCRTTFVGDINPWGTYIPPQSSRSQLQLGSGHITMWNVVELLRDGKRRTPGEIATEMAAAQSTTCRKLQKLESKGYIQRGMRIRPRQRPLPEYWVEINQGGKA